MRLVIAILLGNTLFLGGRVVLQDWYRIHTAPRVRFIVPDGFRGPFVLERDPGAPHPQVEDGWHVLIIGSNGVVALPNPERYEVMRELEAATSSGRKLYPIRVTGDVPEFRLLGSVNGSAYGYVGANHPDGSPTEEQVLRNELGAIEPKARAEDRAHAAEP